MSSTGSEQAPIEATMRSSAVRTERSIALLRITVLAAVIAIALGSTGIHQTLGAAEGIVLLLAGVYAFACLFVSASDEGGTLRILFATLLIDVALITMWIAATGGPRSDFWALYLIVVVSVGLRFGRLETIGAAIGLALLYAAVLMGGRVEDAAMLYRPTLLVLAGVAVGVLTQHLTDQRRERLAATVVAESAARALGAERREVERLRRVDLARSEYVAVAAHELRTPLAAILGVLATLKSHGSVLEEPVREELIDGATVQTERLSRLVEELLTLSRIEDGVLRMSLVAAEAEELVTEAARASSTKDRLTVRIEGDGSVVCDVDAVIRVLTNLLDNARKYSPADAPITLAVSEDPDRVRFSVRDAGPGIPASDREAIFERFRRGGTTKPGSGLGLYISRGLVHAHGGELSVRAAPGGGSEFMFWLPRGTPGKRAVAVGTPADLRVSAIAGLELDVTNLTVPTGDPN
ncbi:MAG TPA: ATP-binding protein [Actinomycetota bacterium]|jgi:signal transduction histidine kinase|nr:ATP-binding protein [Actinomycetota bacterium]